MVLLVGGLIAVSGCDPRTLAYFLQPFESTIPVPEGAPSLEGKKIVILCNVTSGAVAEYPSLERDVPRAARRHPAEEGQEDHHRRAVQDRDLGRSSPALDRPRRRLCVISGPTWPSSSKSSSSSRKLPAT